jgi:hypothetical protein
MTNYKKITTAIKSCALISGNNCSTCPFQNNPKCVEKSSYEILFYIESLRKTISEMKNKNNELIRQALNAARETNHNKEETHGQQ